ncbi:hypothetical protein BA900_06265 [Spiribacter roseus]|jgi:truncated hemoglobin YjbI|uniref:hypothetical protein n=1 Tax=Spiribacter roseus TaxID=1855875 RepID=UPI00349F35C2|nr:hypothetical protein BA900_06265 [Spiribacter roseus]KAF0285761.1 hypothetical protein BA899_00845 [Spiribacter sp. SSL99]
MTDLDSPQAIHTLANALYERLPNDPLVRPVFTETAESRIDDHWPPLRSQHVILSGSPGFG